MTQKTIKRQTQAIHTQFSRRDAYGAISMPVYDTVAFQFDDAKTMSDAFCGRIDAPDYSRVANPTVTFFENKVKAITGASYVAAFNSRRRTSVISKCLTVNGSHNVAFATVVAEFAKIDALPRAQIQLVVGDRNRHRRTNY